MTHLSEADGAAASLDMPPLAMVLGGRFEGLVAPTILGADERRRQAGAIGGFIAAALAFVLASPCLWLADLGPRGAALSIIAAGASLAAAGALAATGRLVPILASTATALGVAVGAVATMTGGLMSPVLWLLAAAPLEAWLQGRRALAGYAAGLGSLVLGAVALLEWFGLDGTADTTVVGWAIGIAAVLYGAILAKRLADALTSARAAHHRRDAEAASIESALTEAVLRFAPDGSLASASRAASVLFSGGGRLLSAPDLIHAIHVTDRVRYLQSFADVRGGADRAVAEIKVKSGVPGARGFVDVVIDLRAVRGAGGRLLSVVGVASDRSAHRAATARLELALADERRNSDAKSQFLAAVSHELRTPLNAIIGFSDVLDQEFFGGFENPRQKEYVGLIRQSGEHLLAVVNSLLDVSKIEAGRYELAFETFLVDEAVRTALGVMRADIERKGLALDVRIACPGASVVADRRACHQILLNLLSNAVKFTDRGTVTLSAEIENAMLAISVADTGIGIAASDLGRLGQPFTQLSHGTTRRYQGTGLGLSLVKGLCLLHGGRMEIASQAGSGTTVTVKIPLDASARTDPQTNLKETVVALAHARTTPNLITPNGRTRRTA